MQMDIQTTLTNLERIHQSVEKFLAAIEDMSYDDLRDMGACLIQREKIGPATDPHHPELTEEQGSQEGLHRLVFLVLQARQIKGKYADTYVKLREQS